MTLLVLDLKLPEAAKTTTDAEVWHQLVDLKSHLMMYALSFIILGSQLIARELSTPFRKVVSVGFNVVEEGTRVVFRRRQVFENRKNDGWAQPSFLAAGAKPF